MPRDQRLLDLVHDSKIDTELLGTCTKHVFYISGCSPRERRICTEERWIRDGFLGQGAYGVVYKEKLEDSEVNKLRAVKEIRKRVAGEELDYTRELEAIVKFSHPKVGRTHGKI
jgi:hypothetical protein